MKNKKQKLYHKGKNLLIKKSLQKKCSHIVVLGPISWRKSRNFCTQLSPENTFKYITNSTIGVFWRFSTSVTKICIGVRRRRQGLFLGFGRQKQDCTDIGRQRDNFWRQIVDGNPYTYLSKHLKKKKNIIKMKLRFKDCLLLIVIVTK